MSDTQQLAQQRSRRSLLAAAVAGAAGIAATRLAGPEAASANNTDPVVIGADNTGTNSTTRLTVTQTAAGHEAGFHVAVTGAEAQTAIKATTPGGTAVDGVATTGIGVSGHGGTGVYASCIEGGTAFFGLTTAPTDLGMEVQGAISFPERSGLATIAAGAKSTVVKVPGVRSSNFAVATFAQNRVGRYVRAAVCGTNKITIYVNSSMASKAKISYIVLGVSDGG